VAGWRCSEKERKREREGDEESWVDSRLWRRRCYNCSVLCHQGRYQSRKDRRTGPACSNLLGTQQAVASIRTVRRRGALRSSLHYCCVRRTDERQGTAAVPYVPYRGQSNPRWGATSRGTDTNRRPTGYIMKTLDSALDSFGVMNTRRVRTAAECGGQVAAAAAARALRDQIRRQRRRRCRRHVDKPSGNQLS